MSEPSNMPPAKTPDPQTKSSPPAGEGKKGRGAVLKDKPDAAVEPPRPAPPPHAAARMAAAAKAANAPQQSHIGRGLFWGALGLVAVLLLGTIGVGVWFYQKRIAPELSARVVAAPAAPAPVVDTSGMEASVEKANAKILELQKQLDAQRDERDRTQARLQEMADRMALVIQQSSFVPKPEAPNQTDVGTGMAALMPSVSPSTSELILLKERNRLAGYADTAIATGSRKALQNLVEALVDPSLANLAHAAQAEYKRVQAYYEISISIDPGYTLPIQQLFKDSAVRAEADLSPAQLQNVLLDPKQPWESRLRCAYLLRASTAPGVDEALIKAIKEDPSLDVAKQAQTSFEKRVARRFRLFDIPAIDAWWQAQGPGKPTAVPMKEPTAK